MIVALHSRLPGTASHVPSQERAIPRALKIPLLSALPATWPWEPSLLSAGTHILPTPLFCPVKMI